ncbi:GatB/GatE catalytic domain-containing protein [Kalaharituber pfeilii]|nr:GatB/GatE catalytic domain-containing protein [Kalaharituber pfeilii]
MRYPPSLPLPRPPSLSTLPARRQFHCRNLSTVSTPPTTLPSPHSPPITPDNSFQKALKEHRKSRARSKKPGSAGLDPWEADDGAWEIVCGLEIHAQLNAARKLFSYAKTSFNESPNTHVALFDAALPGSQPLFQPSTLLPALRAAIALNCEIQSESRFDRKHYFYPDQPSGYQITQFYHPLAKNGYIKLLPTDGVDVDLDGRDELVVGIKQVQMEQDTAKTTHAPPHHLLDLNRVSHPLLEIITTPCLPTPSLASLTLRKIQHLLRFTGAAVLGMEWGGLRCDVNVSVRPRGSPPSLLNQRVEIKNLFSLKVVEEAIASEGRRQIRIFEAGGEVKGETRGWDQETKETVRLRGKEGETDYRYMPDPDIPPVRIAREVVEQVRMGMPMLPDEVVGRLVKGEEEGGFGLSVKDANTLMGWEGGGRVGYYFEVVEEVKRRLRKEEGGMEEGKKESRVKGVGRVVGNWVIHDLASALSTNSIPWAQNPITTTHLSDIVANLLLQRITGPASKFLLQTLVSTYLSQIQQSQPQPTQQPPPPPVQLPTVQHLIATHELLVVKLSRDEVDQIIIDMVLNPPAEDTQAVKMREQYVSVARQLQEEKRKGGGKKAAALEKKLGGLRMWWVGRVVRGVGGRVEVGGVEEGVGRVLGGVVEWEVGGEEKVR